MYDEAESFKNENVWSQTYYLAPYNYLLDTTIVEYDIEKANINVLYSKGAISKETMEKLMLAPKHDREVAIGRMIRREPELQEILSNGIMEARHSLYDKLKLEYDQVLSIKNDAMFIIFKGPVPPIEPIIINEYVKFRPKGLYRSFYRIFRNEFYYDYNPITMKEGLDIKGIGDYGIEMCHGFLNMICDIFYSASQGGAKSGLKKANEVYEEYISMKLPLDFYRRLDSHARFDIVNISNYGKFQADMLAEKDRKIIDTSYNSTILRTLIGYYTLAIIKRKG